VSPSFPDALLHSLRSMYNAAYKHVAAASKRSAKPAPAEELRRRSCGSKKLTRFANEARANLLAGMRDSPRDLASP
jgi:hypothetical protein